MLNRHHDSRFEANVRLATLAPAMYDALREGARVLENSDGTRAWEIEASRIAGHIRPILARIDGVPEIRIRSSGVAESVIEDDGA